MAAERTTFDGVDLRRRLKLKLCKSEEPGEIEAHVVEACCAAWQPKEGDMFTWPVRRCLARRDDKGQLRLGIAEPFGDWISCPWTVCPSCGAPVEVVAWEPEHEEESAKSTVPPWGKWSGEAVTYGTLPQAEDVKGGD